MYGRIRAPDTKGWQLDEIEGREGTRPFFVMKTTIEAKNGGRPRIPNRQGLYSQAAKHAQSAIDTIVALLQSRNEAIRLGAAKALLDKCLPDVKSVNLEGSTDQSPIMIRIIEESKHEIHSLA